MDTGLIGQAPNRLIPEMLQFLGRKPPRKLGGLRNGIGGRRVAGPYWLMVDGSWMLYRFSGGKLGRGWLEIGSATAVAGEHGARGMDAS